MDRFVKSKATLLLNIMLSGLSRTNNCRVNIRFSSTAANNSPTSQSVGEHKRNEVWHKKTSTKSDNKVTPMEILKENSHLKAFGQSKEKIEVDGLMLNWDVAGTGEHVILLLPGALGSIQTDFGPIANKFDSNKYTIVSWDPPGYGWSRPPNRDFSGVYLRRDGHIVVKLMEQLGFTKYSVLGWSNGGNTGGYIAADYPSKVHKLVTFGTHAYLDKRVVNFTKVMTNLEAWHPKMLTPLTTMYGIEYLMYLLQNWHTAVSGMHEMGLDATYKECLPSIKCPVLAIHGENDPIVGVEHVECLSDYISNSRTWILPKAQHNMHLSHADEFLNIVTKFLDS